MNLQGDKGPTFNAVSWVLAGVSLFFVTTRLLSRTALSNDARQRLRVEEWIMVLSIILEIASVAVFSKAISAGVGRHIQAPNPTAVPNAIFWSFAATCMTFFAGSLPKVAVAILLIHIFEPGQPSLWTIAAIAVIQFFTAVITTIMFYTQCKPSAKAWNPKIEGSCWEPHVFTGFSIFASVFAAFTDLVFGTYPALVISRLNMQVENKVGLSLIFAAGLFSCGTEIYKIVLLPSLSTKSDYTCGSNVFAPPSATRALTLNLGTYGDILLWTIIMSDIVIVASCIPTILPFARYVKSQSSMLWSKARSSTSQSKASHQKWPLGQYQSDSAPQRLHSEDAINLMQSSSKTDERDNFIRQTVELDVSQEPCERYAELPRFEAKAIGH